MYAFTAAHRNLPLPSFARVTNLDNGKSVVVRVNDRGPFHENRLIDLSYAAAVKLGFREAGTARVEVRALLPGDAEAAVAAAPSASVQGAASAGHRFQIQNNGRIANADEFDAWMRERQIRIATGVPGKPDPAMRQMPQTATAATATPPQTVPTATPTPAPAAAVSAAATSPAMSSGVELQVASFASIDNAERALQTLQRAGVAEARLMDAAVNGRRVWRLRVGPLSESSVSVRVAQIANLGFGQPTQVRQ